jgi:hypothetical protein
MTHRTATVSKLFAVAALALSAVAAQAVEMRGFRGILWGEPSVQLGAAEVVSQDGEVSCYRRERENLLFGDSEVSSVRYCFVQDQLFFVSIDSDSATPVLANEFGRTYGKPQVQKAGRLVWGGKAGASRAEWLPQLSGQRGSTLMIYSSQFDRNAVKKAVASATTPVATTTAQLHLPK